MIGSWQEKVGDVDTDDRREKGAVTMDVELVSCGFCWRRLPMEGKIGKTDKKKCLIFHRLDYYLIVVKRDLSVRYPVFLKFSARPTPFYTLSHQVHQYHHHSGSYLAAEDVELEKSSVTLAGSWGEGG